MAPCKKIVYIQYTNPASYPPLLHSSQILADNGWYVFFFGTGAFGSTGLRPTNYPKITFEQMSFCPAGWFQKIHYLVFGFWLLVKILRICPKWVYASDPLTCPIAWGLSFLPGLNVIYHEHDYPDRAQPVSSFIRIVLWFRKRLAKRVALNILPNRERLQLFSRETGVPKNLFCVWNCPSIREVSAPRINVEKSVLWVLYHGSIVPDRLPDTILYALAQLPNGVKIRIIGYETIGHPDYIDCLKNLTLQLNVNERVEFLGALPRDSLLEQCQKNDLGLSLMPLTAADTNMQHMTGASNKPFDYLACGLPVIVSDLPDWKEMFVDPGYGLACNPEDPKSIASVIHWFWDHPSEMRAMGEKGRQQIIKEWNYEKQFKSVFEKINKDS